MASGGRSAAVLRSAALVALLPALEHNHLSSDILGRLLEQQDLLKKLYQAAKDEDSVQTRCSGLKALRLVFAASGAQLTEEAQQAAVGKLIKRMEDDSDSVRIATCDAIAALVQTAGSSAGLNMKLLRECMLLHQLDPNADVSAAAKSVYCVP